MAQQAPLRYWIAILVTQGLGVLAVYAGAVYFWSTSLLTLAVFFGIMVLPIAFYAAMASFVLDPTKTSNALVTKDAPTVTRRLWLATSPITACSIIYSGVLLSFHVDAIRTLLVQASSSHGYYQVAERGLFDQAAEVRMAACKSVGEHSPEASTPALAYALQLDDALADCAMEFVGAAANDITIDLRTAQWETELLEMTDNQESERACRLARRLYHADRIGMGSAVPRLLTCATESGSDAARECCAQSLVSAMGEAPSVAALLPAPASFAATSFVERLPGYMRATQSAPKNSLEVALGLNSPTMRAWTIRSACTAIAKTPDVRDGMVNSLADATQSKDCTGPEVNEFSLVAWENACAGLKPETEDSEVAMSVCRSASKNLVEDSNLSAQRLVRRALLAALEPERDARLSQAILTYISAKANDADIPGANESNTMNDLKNSIDLYNTDRLQDVPAFMKMIQKTNSQPARRKD